MAEETKVIDAEVKNEETGMTTTEHAVTTEETKTDVISKVKTGAKIAGAVALGVFAFFAGVAKGKAKSATKSSNEDIVDAEPTSEEDEVSE